MIEWYQVISYFITNGIKVFLCLFAANEFLKTTSFDRRITRTSIISSLFITFFEMLFMSMPQTCLTTVEIVILTVMLRGLFHQKITKCLLLASAYEMVIVLWQFLLSSGVSILFQSRDTHIWEDMLVIWIVALLMIAAIVIIKKSRFKSSKIPFSEIFAVLGVLGVIVLSEQSTAMDDSSLAVHFILSILIVVAVLAFKLNQQYEAEKEIAKLKQGQAEIIERDYRTLNQTYADNAILYHDIHNHIEAIYHCLTHGEIQKATQYCEELRAPIHAISKIVWTGNTTLDYLINSKIAVAEQKNIQTNVNIEYPRNTNIRSVDLTTILGNLLDNAIDAADNAPEHLRTLNLTIRRINDMLIIKIENGYGAVPIQANGVLLTSKSEKNLHGWGLKSVETAAEHYDGTLNTEYADGIFKAVVTLSFQPIKTE